VAASTSASLSCCNWAAIGIWRAKGSSSNQQLQFTRQGPGQGHPHALASGELGD